MAGTIQSISRPGLWTRTRRRRPISESTRIGMKTSKRGAPEGNARAAAHCSRQTLTRTLTPRPPLPPPPPDRPRERGRKARKDSPLFASLTNLSPSPGEGGREGGGRGGRGVRAREADGPPIESRAMLSDTPQNPLYERYASPEMARIFSSRHRFSTWRHLWISLAECERELGLPITAEQIAALKAVENDVDLDRVAEIERRTRHDVVAHIRHYAEQADRVHPGAGGILHLGATSAFITDNTDVLLIREALELLAGRLAATAPRARRLRPANAGHSHARLHALPARPAHHRGQAGLPVAPGLPHGPRGGAPPARHPALPRGQGDDRHPGLLPHPLSGRRRQGARARPAVRPPDRLRRRASR